MFAKPKNLPQRAGSLKRAPTLAPGKLNAEAAPGGLELFPAPGTKAASGKFGSLASGPRKAGGGLKRTATLAASSLANPSAPNLRSPGGERQGGLASQLAMNPAGAGRGRRATLLANGNRGLVLGAGELPSPEARRQSDALGSLLSSSVDSSDEDSDSKYDIDSLEAEAKKTIRIYDAKYKYPNDV